MERSKPIQHTSPVKALREMCIECMGGRETGQSYSKLIAECTVQSCPAFKFRFGKNPFHKKQLTDEQKTGFSFDETTVTFALDGYTAAR